MRFSEALIVSVLGLGVVFLALALLMVMIKLMTAVTDRLEAVMPGKAPEVPEAEAPVAEAVPPQTAPGSAGEVKLHGVEPRTAAMLMAIVADELGAPLNELRFLSIREVKEDEDEV